MVHFTPAKPEHFLYVNVHAVQTAEIRALRTAETAALLSSHTALAAWAPSGACLGLAGIVSYWPGRAEAWALFSTHAFEYIVPIARKVRFVLDNHPSRRIEATVRVDNDKGHRLARLLGFEYEAQLEAFHPDGSDVAMYKRIRR